MVSPRSRALLACALLHGTGCSTQSAREAAALEASGAPGCGGCPREGCSLLQTAREASGGGPSLLQTDARRSWGAAPAADAVDAGPLGGETLAGATGSEPSPGAEKRATAGWPDAATVPAWARHLDGAIRREGQILFDVSDRRSFEKPASTKHPFWVFKADLLEHSRVLACSITMLLAGLLCSAGGIGGGGIYVTVLMVAGQLSVADAVPLSKAVVFLGSISSLVLNARKQFVSRGKTQALIDFNVCRLVVPCSLVGTYLGVLLNRWLPGLVILSVLTTLLLGMTVSIVKTTVVQYMEEEAEAAPERVPEPVLGPAPTVEAPGSGPADTPAEGQSKAQPSSPEPPKLRDTLSSTDMAVAVLMLITVVAFSVLRYHAGQCRDAPEELRGEACNHPAVFWLGGRLANWMRDETEGALLTVAAFLLPLILCSLVSLYYTGILVSQEDWRLTEALKFSSMAIVAGCLAGLVGVGGGLIFAPFFLLMGLEPAIAVATSSTCVIFTSSSTTMQYVLTDRVVMSLAVVYGLVNLAASYTGTRVVHFLQDRHLARRSMISAIVGLGVLVSTALAIVRLVEGALDGLQVDIH